MYSDPRLYKTFGYYQLSRLSSLTLPALPALTYVPGLYTRQGAGNFIHGCWCVYAVLSRAYPKQRVRPEFRMSPFLLALGIFSDPDSSPRLNCSEEFKVSLSAHSCGAEIVPDNEHRNLVVHGDHYRSWNAGLCIDEMVAARSLKLEPVLLKYSDEGLIRNRGDFWHVSALELAVFFPARQSPVPSSLPLPW